MSALGSLVVKLALEYAQYTGGLDKSEQATLASLKRIQGAADQFSSRVTDGLKNGLGGLAAFFTAGAIVNQVKSVVDELDRIGDAAAAIGLTTQAMAELGFAANQSGTDAQTLEGAMGKLNLKISEGVGGNKEAVKLFAALGVQLKDTDGQVRSTDSVLAELADTFKALPEGPQKSALAVELFGKSGAGLLQFLSQGSEGIQGLREEFVALSGGSIEDAAELAGAFNDQLDKLSVMSQAATMRFGSELLPTLVAVGEMFTATGDNALGMGEGMDLASTAGAGLRTLLEFVLLVGSDVAFVLHGIGTEIGGIAAQAAALLRGDFAGAGAIRDAMVKDAEEARRKLDEFQRRVVNPGQATAPAGPTTGDGSRQDRERASSAAAAALRTESTAAKAAEDAYAKLMDSIRARMGLADQQLALGRELTEGEKFQAKAKEDLAKIAAKLSSGQAAAAEAEIAAVKARIDQAEIEKQLAKELLTIAQDRQRVRQAESDGIAAWFAAQEEASASTLQGLKDRLDGLRNEERAVALSRERNISLAEAIEEVAIARLQEKQAGLREGSEEYERVEREIAARRELGEVLGQQNIRQREEQGWSDMWASVDRTAHDVFVNVFEGGSNVFKRLGQTLKASVLDVLYQMTVRKWIINIGTSIFGGGFGAAASAATGGGAGGVGGNLLNGASLLGRVGGGFGMGLNAGFSSLFGEAGLMGALDAGGIALGAGNIMGGLGTIAGALGPIALGVGAVVSLLNSMDDSGTMHTGALSQYSATGGLANSTTHGAFGMGFGGVDYSAETEKFTGAMAQSIVSMLDSTATTFGKDAGYRAATAFADDTSKDGAWGGLLISRLEETIINWDTDRTSKWAPREFADGAAGKEQYLAAVAQDVRAALDSIGLPGWATNMLDKLGDGASLEQLAGVVDQINAAKGAFAAFGQYMPIFGSLADSTLERLVESSGGVGALSANMSSFVANFYSDAERLEVASANLTDEFAKLGLEVPRTKEEFRDLVQAQIALGDAGADTVARLLALGDAFASVVDGASSMDTSLGITAETIAGILDAAIEQAGSAQEASRLASQAFEEQIYGGMRDNMLGGLSDMLMGAINPMINSLVGGAAASSAALAAGGAAAAGSLVAGGSMGASASASGGAAAAGAMASGGSAAAGALVSGGAAAGAMVTTVLDQARAYVSAFSTIMADPEVQAMITEISGLVGGVAGTAYDGLGSWGGGGGGGSWQSPGSPSAPAAADDYNDALKSIGNTLEEEVKRLRGLMVNDSSQSRAVLESQFATATAAARAGDQTALAKLPSISKQLEKATEDSATSAVEVARMRGWLAGSITETMKLLGLDVPQFAVGTNYVPKDMLAMIHEGEAIVPKAFNPAAGGAGLGASGIAPGPGESVGDYGAELVSEMRGVRRELSALREQGNSNTLAVQRLNLRSAKTLERVENILAMQK